MAARGKLSLSDMLHDLLQWRPDLGRSIGSPAWFGQTFLLAGLVSTGIGLGMISTPSPASLTHYNNETSTQVTAPALDLGATSEAARLAMLTPEAVLEPAVTKPEVMFPDEIVQTVVEELKVKRGETLMTVLLRAGVDRREANRAINALARNFNMRRLQVGQRVSLTFTDQSRTTLAQLALKKSVDKTVIASRDDEGRFASEVVTIDLDRETVRARGQINDSLYMAMSRAGVPPSVIADLIMIFSFDVDFQREIRAGDKFEIFFEQYRNENDQVVKNGDVLFGSLTLRGKPIDLYRFVPTDDNRADYFNAQGHSVRRALLRTPIDGARLTSRFGKRRHPILGYTKMHTGADFGARRGTPVRAAGDGVIEKASRFGGYGKYVRIRHNGTYKTAYAHLNGYGAGIKKGVKVRQGEIIGYVGSTGRSTGPHLHYEVIKEGKKVNPLSLKLPSGRRLEGDQLAAFQSMLEIRKTEIASAPVATQLASTAGE